MIKLFQTTFRIASFLLLMIFPLALFAAVTTSDLVSSNYSSTCLFTQDNDVSDLNNILNNNLCGTELSNLADIKQCARMAETQYALCRYHSILNKTAVDNYQNITITSDQVSNSSDLGSVVNSNNDAESEQQNQSRANFNWF